MRIYLICLILAFSSASAETVVINFETGWEDAGFDLSVFAGGTSGPDLGHPQNPTSVFLWCTGCDLGFPDAVTLDHTDGLEFSLSSLDIGNYDGSGSSPIELTGYYAAGGTVTTTFEFGDVWDTYTLDSAWQGLTSVELVAYSTNVPGIDNIVVSAVPIPAAAWLFGSALAGLGWMRRKQTVQ